MHQLIRIFARTFFVLFSLSTSDAFAAASNWVDIRIDNGKLLLDSKVAGVQGHAMIDSGAGVNAVNQRFLDANKLEFKAGQAVKIEGVFGQEKRRTFQKIPVELFGNTINFRDVVSINFGAPEIQLLLGASFLELFVFQFDYPNRRMRVITRDTLDMKKLKNVESKRDRKTGEPIVRVRLNDEKNVWLLMDTGNTGGMLIERQIATRAGWLDKYPVKTVGVRGVTTGGQTERFNLPTMSIGPFDLSDAIVGVAPKGKKLKIFEKTASTGSRLKSSRAQSQGLLGYDVLKHFIVTIDYKAGFVHLAPGEPAQTESPAQNPSDD